MKESPVKSAFYVSLVSGAVYATKTNPTERELKSRLVENMNKSALMSDSIRNKTVDRKLNHLFDCFNKNTLR